ncbi:MAG: hypothetical protein GY926_00915 [bacterium]|nr:hypothetical protein [bacterium]
MGYRTRHWVAGRNGIAGCFYLIVIHTDRPDISTPSVLLIADANRLVVWVTAGLIAQAVMGQAESRRTMTPHHSFRHGGVSPSVISETVSRKTPVMPAFSYGTRAWS